MDSKVAFESLLHRTSFAIVATAALTIAGCGIDPGALFLDETSLVKVANYYYRPGEKKALSRTRSYRLLATKAKEQLSRDEWVAETATATGSPNQVVVAVEVLGEKDESGKKYSVVSIAAEVPDASGKKLKEIRSETWFSESGRWRLLYLPKTAAQVKKVFDAGDYAAAKARAEEWLAEDPYSVQAYQRLGFALERSDSSSYKRGDRSRDDVVRTLLAMNPNDTRAIFLAASWSTTTSIAKAYLKRLEGRTLYSLAAFNVALNITPGYDQLTFLEGMEITPSLGMLKMDSLATMKAGAIRSLAGLKEVLGSRDDARKFLREKITTLTKLGPQFRAGMGCSREVRESLCDRELWKIFGGWTEPSISLDDLQKSWSGDFRMIAANEGAFEKVKTELADQDATFAAEWAGKVGLALHEMCLNQGNDSNTARKWLEYGMTRDPNNKQVKNLAVALDSPCQVAPLEATSVSAPRKAKPRKSRGYADPFNN